MPPALFNLLTPTLELRQVSPDLRSDHYADAVRRETARREARVVATIGQLLHGYQSWGHSSRLATH